MAIHDNILIKMRDMKESLTPAGETGVRIYPCQPDEIPHLSIKQLAQLSKTSDEQFVLRFCKTMGFSGYRSFIVSISASIGSMEDEQKDQYTDIQPWGDDLTTIIANISCNNMKSIEDTLSVLDCGETPAPERAAGEQPDCLLRVGASGLVCKDGEQKFSRINKMCHAYVDGQPANGRYAARQGDVAIFTRTPGIRRNSRSL